MAFGDLVFGKPVLLQTKPGKTMCNLKGTNATLVKVADGEDVCVQLTRHDDGSVSIQSMRSKLYLTVDEENDDPTLCEFSASEITATEKFLFQLADKEAFIITSALSEYVVEHTNAYVVCERKPIYPFWVSMLWTLKEPEGVPGMSTQVNPIGSSRAEDALNQRHDDIMEMVMAGKSVQYIDEILSRLYGSTQSTGTPWP